MLRQATSADIAAIQRVRRSVRENRLVSTTISDADVLEAIERTGRGWVVELDGEVVAFAIGNGIEGNLWALFVDPDHEGRGHGRVLHDAAVAWLGEQGHPSIRLTTEPGTRAQAFYERAGWRCVGPAEHGEMRYELSLARGRFPPAAGRGPGGSTMAKKLIAELLGTFWLVFGGCGAAVLAAAFGGTDSNLGIGLVGVSFAFGLTVLTMAYAIGHVSGCHLNPAVTLGLVAGNRHPAGEALPYIAAQTVGAAIAAGVLYAIASGKAGFEVGGFASNGFGELSPGGYGLVACALAEVVLTFFFLLIILGATDRRAPAGFAPIAIGLGLTLIHLISIPVTNTSVNPARSTGAALFAETAALSQLWLFWVAPIVGAVLAGVAYRALLAEDSK